MTPALTPTDREETDDPERTATEEDADLHPDVRAVMRATEALPVHDDSEEPVIELPTEGGGVRASIPTNATDSEAAVIAVALTAHLRDEEAAASDSGPTRVDPWQLCNRVGREVGGRLRETPVVGEVWKMTGRVRARR